MLLCPPSLRLCNLGADRDFASVRQADVHSSREMPIGTFPIKPFPRSGNPLLLLFLVAPSTFDYFPLFIFRCVPPPAPLSHCQAAVCGSALLVVPKSSMLLRGPFSVPIPTCSKPDWVASLLRFPISPTWHIHSRRLIPGLSTPRIFPSSQEFFLHNLRPLYFFHPTPAAVPLGCSWE